MTKLEFVNKIFLQWLFIRLERCHDLRDNSHYYGIMFFVKPCTGWKVGEIIKPVGVLTHIRITKKIFFK